jgi:hypothetical protein
MQPNVPGHSNVPDHGRRLAPLLIWMALLAVVLVVAGIVAFVL